MRKQIAAANWKMNGTWSQANTLLQDILKEKVVMGGDRQTLFAVPFPYLTAIHTLIKDMPGYAVAAQNCHHERSGAFTGEVSAAMLQSLVVAVKWAIPAAWVILVVLEQWDHILLQHFLWEYLGRWP